VRVFMSFDHVQQNRERFLEYNSNRYNQFLSTLDSSRRLIFKTIPLLFHINSNKLPGFVNDRTPCGIKNFTDTNACIRAVRLLNNETGISDQLQISEYFIESVYLQDCFRTGKLILWVIHLPDIPGESLKLLRRKSEYINKWLLKNGLSISIYTTTASNISNTYYDSVGHGFHIDKKFFLNDFYSESILIAGKPDFWWLTSDYTELSYRQAIDKGLIEEDEYIECDGAHKLRTQDYYSAAIWYLLNMSHSPATTWLDLLLLLNRILSDDDTYSSRLKSMVHEGIFLNLEIEPRCFYATFLNNTLSDVASHNIALVNNQLLQVLSCYYESSQSSIEHSKSIFDHLYTIRNDRYSYESKLELQDYIYSLESIYKLTEKYFSWIHEKLINESDAILDRIRELNPMSERMLMKLKHSSKNLHILKHSNKVRFNQEKIIISINNGTLDGNWELKIPCSDSTERTIKTFDSLIELLTWSYINQVIDTATQISSRCSYELISSIDMINIVKVLSDNIDLNMLDALDLNVFTSNAIPVKSIVFVDMHSNSTQNEVAQISQLIIYNTGEFHTLVYKGYDNFIACIYNWFNLLDKSVLSDIPSIQIYGIKPGKTRELETNIDYLLHELGGYFSKNPTRNTRTILKKDDKYYVSHISDNKIDTDLFDDMHSLYQYLEKPLDEYTSCMFTDTFERDAMLGYLLRQNKQDTIQMFYFIENQQVRTFFFDENGALFTYVQKLYNRQCFINHWILFLHNMLKKYTHSVAVEINQLIKLDDTTYEHIPLTGNMLPTNGKCFDLDMKIYNKDNNINVSFTYEDKEFNSSNQGSDLYFEISKFISRNCALSKNIPVYVSNIDMPDAYLPGSDSESMHLIDYLKYKRNVESRLNQKINDI
jgi:adenylate cyclase, class 1